MNISTWSDEERSAVRRMAAEGLTGQQIADALRRTRNSVLGYCHRQGIRLAMTEAKKVAGLARLAARPRQPKPEKDWVRFPPGHAVFRGRPRGSRAFSDDEIAAAIAAHLAGLSRNKAARMIGASPQSLTKSWMRQADLMAKGRALFEIARADAADRAARRRALENLSRDVEAMRIERHNEPVFALMNERQRAICARRIAGETLASIAASYGLTRERIRQIEVQWRIKGLEVPGATPLEALALNHIYLPKGKQPRTKASGISHEDFWAAAQRRPGRPKGFKLSDEQRQAASAHMQAVWAERRA